MQYTDESLSQLHRVLAEILKETVCTCEKIGVKYFILGGTAIGAYFHKGIIPWDDDIDIGMTRDDYERFLKEAPTALSPGYFLQCFDTDPETPFYFAKVRKDGTTFLEEQYKDLKIHHGIFVDIFPLDKVPDSPFTQKIHRRVVNYLDGSFKRSVVKECIREGMPHLPTAISEVLTDIRFSLIRMIPRRFLYWRLHKVMGLFNSRKFKYVNIVKMPHDHIPVEDVRILRPVTFEGMKVWAPSNLERYLWHHYPNLQAFPPIEDRINHCPLILSFDNTIK